MFQLSHTHIVVSAFAVAMTTIFFRLVDISQFRSGLLDMAAGTTAGVISKIVEYPFDTLKVRFQTERVNTSVSGVTYFFKFIQTEGWEIFRGLPVVVAGAAVENLIVFSMYGAGERFFQRKMGRTELTTLEIAACGLFAGIGVGLWLTPVEWIKVRMQSRAPNQKIYGTTWECFRDTVSTKPSLLTQGLTATLVREGIGNFMYFVGYHVMASFLSKIFGGGDPGTTSVWVSVIAGGFAGVCYWCSIFPVDLAKSRVQSGVMEDEGLVSFLWDQFDKYGFLSLYDGLAVTVPRAILSNAIIFTTVEQTKSFLERYI